MRSDMEFSTYDIMLALKKFQILEHFGSGIGNVDLYLWCSLESGKVIQAED
jgi:hypothetical protein